MVEDMLFFDLTLSMGLQIAAYICQRVTDALIFIYRKTGHEGINYLDDLGAAEKAELADIAFNKLGEVLREIGVWESVSEACTPSYIMIFLGILMNTRTMTLHITPDRVKEIQEELVRWGRKKSATLREVQSLIGKLSFAATTVQAGRLFFSRILTFMWSMPSKGKRRTPRVVQKDIEWWRFYMSRFDGRAMMLEQSWTQAEEFWCTDAALDGCGGWSQKAKEYFHCTFPATLQNKDVHINELECLAIVLALKKWGHLMKRKKCLVNCDNEVTMMAINTGRARNELMQQCLREIAFILANNSAMIKVQYLTSTENEVADYLSRWGHHHKFRDKFNRMNKQLKLNEIKITAEDFIFNNKW